MDEALRRWREARQPEALGELLKRQRDRAYSVAMRLVGSPADAEDVVQEAFLKLFSRTHGFEDAEAFELSVYRAVVQCALDALKQGRRRRIREQVEAVARARDADVRRGETREAQAEREELKTLLRDAVKELGEDERAPVVLCYQQGLTVSQAARVLDLPRETVRARLHRALGALRRWLGRRGKRSGVALILLLLWQDGLLAAPDSLCRSLDAALPGPPCGELPALPQPGPAGAPPIPWPGVVAGTGLVAAALVAGILCVAGPAGKAHGPEAGSAGGSGAVPERAAPEEPKIEVISPAAPSRPEQKREENQDMRKTLGVLTLAGVAALPFTAFAEEPNPEVGKVIATIEARRAAKTEAETKALQENQKRGWREQGGRSVTAPGAAVVVNPGPNGAAPGQPVVIELRENK